MRIVVSDVEPIGELLRVDLAADLFGLPHQFHAVDLCAGRACSAAETVGLRKLGFIVEELDGTGVADAVRIARANTRLSLHDAMSVVLARRHEGAILTTHSSFATLEQPGIATVSMGWVFDLLSWTVPAPRLATALGSLSQGARSGLTAAEIQQRLKAVGTRLGV